MREGRVARRYAEALLNASVEKKAEDEVASDIRAVKKTIEGSRELQLLLRNPVIKWDTKRDALRAVFSGSVGPLVLDFLSLVAEKRRETALPAMIERFEVLRNERLGNLEIGLAAATPLDAGQTSDLKKRFSGLTGKNIVFSERVDVSLKGGFLARVGDTVFDGTIKRQLEIMRQRFLKGNGTN